MPYWRMFPPRLLRISAPRDRRSASFAASRVVTSWAMGQPAFLWVM